MKTLRKILLVLGAGACFVLLCSGTLAALPLGFFGILGFAAGLSPVDLHLLGVALFGLITVGLCSVCCFSGLVYLLNGCIDNLGNTRAPLKWPLLLMTLLSVAATAVIFISTSGDWFLQACIAADAVHIASIAVYLRSRKRSHPCTESSSSSPDSPPSLSASG